MFFNLPSGAKVDKYMAGMPSTSWATWTNPRNEYTNAIIIAAGGGGGGNGGGAATGGSAGSGGGFGHIYCPLSLLPDTLYISVGVGGVGGVGGSGANGNPTYISMYPSFITTSNLLMACGGGGRGAGVGGSGTIYNTLGIAQGYTGGTGTSGVGNGTAPSSLPITG